jgi:hypothetical protein
MLLVDVLGIAFSQWRRSLIEDIKFCEWLNSGRIGLDWANLRVYTIHASPHCERGTRRQNEKQERENYASVWLRFQIWRLTCPDALGSVFKD